MSSNGTGTATVPEIQRASSLGGAAVLACEQSVDGSVELLAAFQEVEFEYENVA